MKNEGEDAYKPEIYGKSIMFTRTIWDSGQTGVLIKNYNGETIYKKTKDSREEGKRILECFRINTDNPIAILQQEEAKELLKVESPGALYNFFLKSTLLKQCLEQYTGAQTELSRTKDTIKDKESAMQELQKKFNEKRAKYNEIVKKQKWAEEEKKLSQEYVVALGLDKLEEIKAAEEEISKKAAAEEKAKEKLHVLNNANGETDRKRQELEIRLEDERLKYASKEVELSNMKLEIDRLKEDEKVAVKDIKGLEVTRKAVVGEIGILEEQFDSMNSAQSLKLRRLRAKERAEELKEVQNRMDQINDEIEQLGINRDSIEGLQEKNKKECDGKEYEKKSLQVKSANLQKELEAIEKSGNRQLAIIDPMAPKVAERIRDAARRQMFGVCPIGPVGSFIKLSSSATSNNNLPKLLETEIGANILRSYLCNDDGDRKTLWEIFDQVYGGKKKPQIFTSRFLKSRHNVNKVANHQTVMDFLEFVGSPSEQTVVFNHLVDQKSIESVVVAKSQDEAKKLCTYIQNVPKNLNYCITLDFNRFFPPTKTASYRSYYIDPVSTTVLGSNMESKMEEKRREIDKNEEQLQEIVKTLVSLQKIKNAHAKEFEDIKNKIAKYREELAKGNATKSRLKAEEDPADNSDALQEKIVKKRAELKTILKNQDIKVDEKKKIFDQTKLLQSDYNQILKVVTKLREATAPLESEKNKLEGQLSSKRKEITNQEKVARRFKEEVGKLKTHLSQLKKDQKELKKKAEKLNAPPDLVPTETSKQLSAKINNIRKKQLAQAGVENPEEVQNELLNLQKSVEQARTSMKSLKDMVQKLEGMDVDRHSNYLFIRNTISNMVQRQFSMLSETFRKQFGTNIYITLNHKKRELNFVFKNADGDYIDTEINSLSGGEKSYAQVSQGQHFC